MGVGTYPPSAGVKLVQRGSSSSAVNGDPQTVDVTITAVNMSKAFVVAYLHQPSAETSAAPRYVGLRPYLTSTTNLRLQFSVGSSVAVTVTWEVVEFF